MTQDEVEVEVRRIMEAQWKWAVEVETKKEVHVSGRGTKGLVSGKGTISHLGWKGSLSYVRCGLARYFPHSRGIALSLSLCHSFCLSFSLAALFWGVIQRVVNHPGPGPYRTQSEFPFPFASPACHHARRNFSPFPLAKSAALIGLGRLYRARERSTD